MKAYDVQHLRNVGLIGQGGAGKTSLAEAMLFDAGATQRLGKVSNGSSIFDYDPDEVTRQKSLNAMLGFCEWKNQKINIVDTPGYANFAADTQGCMRVLEGAIVLLDVSAGLKVQTEKVWKWADDAQVRRLIFLNQMDEERADFEGTLDQAAQVLSPKPVAIQIPIGKGPDFRGVVDLLDQKAWLFASDGSGKMEGGEVPAELQKKVGEARENLIELIAETDDKLLENYLETGELPVEEARQAMAVGVRAGKLVPALCGSAVNNMGVQPLLDAISAFLPSPLERPPVEGTSLDGDKTSRAEPKPDAPLVAQVFKTLSDPYAGRLTFFRVFSGTLRADSTIYNSAQKEKERVGQLFFIQGKEQKLAPTISAGDFGAVAKLKITKTGDTLCDEKTPLLLPPIPFPSPVLSLAIVPKAKGDEEKVGLALGRLVEENPTLQVGRDLQTNEMIISGMGDLHLEVMVERMKRKFGVEVEAKTPRVPYKETVRSSAKAQGKYKKQTGGRGQYGDAWIEIKALPHGQGFEFVNKIVGGAIPRQYIPAVEKGIVEAMGSGPLAGYPVVDLRATLYDGTFHAVDSSEMAFKIAGSLGFKKAFQEAKPILLEPVMNIEVEVPDELVGDAIGDLNSRRGKVLGVRSAFRSQVVSAQVPMVEVLTYASTLRSMTADRGSFSMEFSHYEEVPSQLAEKLISQSAKES